MTAGESVTCWIDQLKGGDRDAVQRLFERYYGRLVREARRWLRRAPAPPAADEDDIALGAFDSFCRRAEQGRFPRLYDRDDLWQLLVVIAFRKTCNQIKHERARRPPNGHVINASALAPGRSGRRTAPPRPRPGRRPAPRRGRPGGPAADAGAHA